MIGGRGFRGFVLIAIGKMAILTIFLQLQDNIKLIRRYEGWYYTRLVSYYIIFHFETDWSRIRPLPSTNNLYRKHALGVEVKMDDYGDFEQFLVRLDDHSVDKYKIGAGSFGVVYRSTINGAPCAVKKLYDPVRVSMVQWRTLVQSFRKEIALLSQQRHPNIVQFLGIYKLSGDPRDICLVMEKLDVDLKNFIAANAEQVVPMEVKLKILTDIACGVSHLHSKGIIHCNLCGGTVLLSSDLRAKVASLFVSRFVDKRQLGQLTEIPGDYDYMPPETFGSHPVYNLKLDCFSFGNLALYLCLQVTVYIIIYFH